MLQIADVGLRRSPPERQAMAVTRRRPICAPLSIVPVDWA